MAEERAGSTPEPLTAGPARRRRDDPPPAASRGCGGGSGGARCPGRWDRRRRRAGRGRRRSARPAPRRRTRCRTGPAPRRRAGWRPGTGAGRRPKGADWGRFPSLGAVEARVVISTRASKRRWAGVRQRSFRLTPSPTSALALAQSASKSSRSMRERTEWKIEPTTASPTPSRAQVRPIIWDTWRRRESSSALASRSDPSGSASCCQ